MEEKSISKFFQWFGLQDDEVMQLNAFDVFRQKKQYAVTEHARTLDEVLEFCRKYHDMFLLAGLNPRPLNFLGTHRDAREEDMERIRHLLYDIEPVHKKEEYVGKNAVKLVWRFAEKKMMPYIGPSKLCFSGNGFHILAAIPQVNLAEDKSFKQRVEAFRAKMIEDLGEELDKYGIRIDSTSDYIRRVKIYGTKKQYPGSRVSMWLGDSSKEINHDLLNRILATEPITVEKPLPVVQRLAEPLTAVERAYERLKECPAYYMVLKEPNPRQWQDREFLVKFLKYFLGLGFEEIKEFVARYNGWANFNPKMTEEKIGQHFREGSYATRVKTYVRKRTLVKFGLCPDNCRKCIYEQEKTHARE